MLRSFLPLAALAAGLFTAPGTSAQSRTEGLQLGARVYAASLNLDDPRFDDQPDGGGGLGVEVAYGFSRSVSVFLALGGARMTPEPTGDPYSLGTGDLGVRAHLRPSTGLDPYLQLALTGQTATIDVVGTAQDVHVRGGGLTLGVGLLVDLSRSVALDLGLDVTGGRFTEIEFGGTSTSNVDPANNSIARLGVGVVAHL